MRTDFLPSREAELVTWTSNFSQKINATATAFGLTAAQATSYGTLNTAFISAYQTANDPSTRSPSNIVAKNTAMTALKANARELARIVQATPSVTPEQKSELGLTVRDGEGSPIPAPATAPQIDLVSMVGRTLSIRLHDGDSTRRGKPAGVQGASVFSFVGATPPADPSDWKFEGSTTRTTVDLRVDAALVPGPVVWLTAFWYDPRGQSGPGCTPGSAILAGGGMSMAA